MAVLRVNPTRVELSRLKKRLAVAVRGHKLLKDKRDEMMRRFIELIRKNKSLREQVEAELTSALGDFVMARAVMSPEVLEEAVMYPTREVELKISKRNIMNVDVPRIDYEEKSQEGLSSYPYGFVSTSAELDGAIVTLSGVLSRMLELAEIEKTCQMLADEIEKTRRRVNALEYIMIPQLEETIRYITMKMDEDERSSRTRLMKVKDMIEERKEKSADSY
ncbi:MAG: V-type ATP synthase subunit D [Caldicoprobacterales bacterium]|jgi:V/A-type H+-transporting ATPase subunit D|nr:V-type ATP synthase subunit D [Clostridiales bacterium]